MLLTKKFHLLFVLAITFTGSVLSCAEDDNENARADSIDEIDDDDNNDLSPEPPTKCSDLGIDFGLDIDGERSAELLPMDEIDLPELLLELQEHVNKTYDAGNYEDIYYGLSDEFYERFDGISAFGSGCNTMFFTAAWKTQPKPGRQGYSILMISISNSIIADTDFDGFLIQDLDDLADLFPQYSTEGISTFPDLVSTVTPENAQFFGTVNIDAVTEITGEFLYTITDNGDSEINKSMAYGSLDFTFVGEEDFAGMSRHVTGNFCSLSDISDSLCSSRGE